MKAGDKSRDLYPHNLLPRRLPVRSVQAGLLALPIPTCLPIS
jgi:hypothetical protein